MSLPRWRSSSWTIALMACCVVTTCSCGPSEKQLADRGRASLEELLEASLPETLVVLQHQPASEETAATWVLYSDQSIDALFPPESPQTSFPATAISSILGMLKISPADVGEILEDSGRMCEWKLDGAEIRVRQAKSTQGWITVVERFELLAP